jgi:uncharacterized protein (TIGR04206 family)
MTGAGILDRLMLVIPWTVAIVSVTGTLVLFAWIIMMIVKKDRPK